MRGQHLWQLVSKWLSASLLLAAVVAPVALLVWFIFFTSVFFVQAITVLDARPHTTETIQQLIHEHLSAAHQSGFGRNIFFVSPASLEHRILSTLPQVRSVRVTRELPGTIKVVVQEKTPALLLLAATKYYFVDAQGIAYEEARLETLPGTIVPTVKTSDQKAVVTLGAPVVSADFVQFIAAIQEKLPDVVPAHVVELRMPSLAAREIQLRLDNNWQIRFDTTRDFMAQLHLLKQLLETTVPLKDQAAVEYIDLRIPNRIYYKIRENVSGQRRP